MLRVDDLLYDVSYDTLSCGQVTKSATLHTFLICLILFWAMVALSTCFVNLSFRKNLSESLQRGVVILPVTKAILMVLLGLNMALCESQSEIGASI